MQRDKEPLNVTQGHIGLVRHGVTRSQRTRDDASSYRSPRQSATASPPQNCADQTVENLVCRLK